MGPASPEPQPLGRGRARAPEGCQCTSQCEQWGESNKPTTDPIWVGASPPPPALFLPCWKLQSGWSHPWLLLHPGTVRGTRSSAVCSQNAGLWRHLVVNPRTYTVASPQRARARRPDGPSSLVPRDTRTLAACGHSRSLPLTWHPVSHSSPLGLIPGCRDGPQELIAQHCPLPARAGLGRRVKSEVGGHPGFWTQ